VGSALVATAWTADGLVEALEDIRTDRFAVGVQWHPEIAWEHDEFSQALFGRFIDCAGGYAHTTAVERERELTETSQTRLSASHDMAVSPSETLS
jgi:hypothetical protein